MKFLMNKSDLLYYDAYEQFYEMTNKSAAFATFCKDAFGEDFSQDGFSDIEQIDMILPFVLEKTANLSDIFMWLGSNKSCN